MTEPSRLRTTSTPDAPAGAPLSQALRAAAVAAVSSWLPLVLVAVVGWAGSARTTVGWDAALGVGSLAWVAAHLGSLRSGGTTLSLTPLLLTALPLAACSVAARTLAGAVETDRTPRVGWLGGMRSGVARLLGIFVLAYAVLGAVVALHAASMPVGPSWPSTLLGVVALPVVGVLVGLRHAWSRPAFAPSWHDHAAVLLPSAVRRGLAVGPRGVGALLLAGLLPVVASFVAHLSRVRDLTAALDAGALGNAVLAVVQLGWLPDAAAWGLSWLAGPGFSVGLGSTYTWRQAQSGLLPMVPVLGALPDNGPLPWWTALAGLVPVLVGALVARWAVSRLPALSTLSAKAQAAGAAWLATVLGSLVVLALASGSLGAKALVAVGPHLWQTTLALAGELGLGVLVVLGLTWRRYH
ncbi:cell division protein PerM [Arsenicicoccus sp. oral taxon 190]|uniref:cell division protein PerM n=1 Tax=Arsenicicoccus sp. oral taxon 190 TaxID=1658671 RepID=UPI00067A0271|nr:DUF6350 family protein [Arsenicicoccus sp. oral taxon 190]AKT52459.1 hypothetical protein ADJ73_16410 [Arsenicicoccus sp. oral taxon 190]